MSPAQRRSPLHSLLERLDPHWKMLNGMAVAWHIGKPGDAPLSWPGVALCDASCFPRFGIKGPAAEEWLTQQGIQVPAAPNTWIPRDDGGFVARLGQLEFLLEDGLSGKTVQQLSNTTPAVQDGYAVPRQDAVLALRGLQVKEILGQVCALPLEKACAGRHVVMTLLAGVGVTVIRVDQNEQPDYRIWSDGTYGPYLWNTLLQLIEEVGGRAVGLAGFYLDTGLS